MKRRRMIYFLAGIILAGSMGLGLSACGEEKHDFVYVPEEEASCTEEGTCAHYHCNICGKDFSFEGTYIEQSSLSTPPRGHEYSAPITTRKSCTEPGTVERTCKKCGYVEKTVLVAGEHVFRSYITDPTCIKDGQNYRVCLMCGFSKTEVIPATGVHVFGQDNVCTLCNLRCVPSEGLEYETVIDEGMQVGYRVKCGTAEGDIVIPYYYESLPVLEIAKEGFAEKPITGVVCYAPLRVIGERAFFNCRKLSSVNLPNTLETIGSEAFSSCIALTRISLPDSLKELGGSSFYQCEALKTLEVGAGLKDVGELDFWNCSYLSVINVSEENPYLRSEGNCLIKRDTDTLIVGGCESVIPGNVKVIGANAFLGRREIKKIVIPKSVTKICDFAFRDCLELREVQYAGTQSEWEQVEKGAEWSLHTSSEFHVTFMN